jgi:RHS repeat-associated protein
MGAWSYQYDVLDELTSQTDAKGQTSSLTYDLLGRVTSRTDPSAGSGGLTSTWTYGTSAAAKNVGKLTQATTNAGYARDLTYDALGRPAASQLTIGGAAIGSYTALYDANGRLDKVTYPSSFQAQYVYTALGYPSSLKDAVGGFVFWTANAMNAEGRLTQETAGNGIVSTRGFDPLTGRLTSVAAGSGNSVANLGFAYDALGNLASRSDSHTFGSESFTCDALNRLLTAQVSGQAVHSASYNAVGNILSKTRLDNNALLNTYAYNAPGGARPHAVASVAGLVNGVLNPVYTYDLNGNLTSGAGRTVTWIAFNMVATIVQGATTMSYAYDSEHARITQSEVNGANTTTTTYLNDPASGISSEKVVVAGATTTWTDYLFAGGARIAQRSMVVGGATTLRYFIADHLGSIAIITDGGGAVLERLAYDAWGRRRNTNGTDDPAGSITSSTTRGFTDHEHIGAVGLVNMNGRVYDPELGRFLSADPIVQSILYSQFLNRYSYCSNEPTVCVDPSGNFGFFGFVAIFSGIASLFTNNSIVHTIAAIAIGFAFSPAGDFFLAGLSKAGNALLGGFIAGGVTGHNLQSALFSGLQAFAFAGVGLFKEKVLGIPEGSPGTFLQRLESAALHGLVGGLASDARGGKFGAGFLSAGFSDFAGSYVHLGSVGANTVAIAVIGGVSSKLGGGKFGNGAITAAFGYLYNAGAHYAKIEYDLGGAGRLKVVDGVLTGTIRVGCGNFGETNCGNLIADLNETVNANPNMNITFVQNNRNPDLILFKKPDLGPWTRAQPNGKFIEFNTSLDTVAGFIAYGTPSHEFFHWLGLGHNNFDPASIMYGDEEDMRRTGQSRTGNTLLPTEENTLINAYRGR